MFSSVSTLAVAPCLKKLGKLTTLLGCKSHIYSSLFVLEFGLLDKATYQQQKNQS